MKWMSVVTQYRSFLADPFRNTHDLRLSCRSNVLAHCMRPQKSLRWVWRLGERWTFRIDHGQSHVHVRHVVFIMSCIHIQRHDSECQTFRSEVCRPPFEYGIRHYQLPILIRGVLTRQHVRYSATE